MRIGMYGGAFNPIHNGHLHIVREYIRRLSLDRVLLIPTGTSPHKAAVPDAASAEDRLAMCRLACAGEEKILVSDCEIRREGKSYTADTITWLKTQFPGDELYLLMGEDMFLTVDRWFDAPRIIKNTVLCGTPRSTDGRARMLAHAEEIRAAHPYARTQIADISFMDVSSTMVREARHRGEDVSALVPAGVAAYMEEHGLFCGGNHETE